MKKPAQRAGFDLAWPNENPGRIKRASGGVQYHPLLLAVRRKC